MLYVRKNGRRYTPGLGVTIRDDDYFCGNAERMCMVGTGRQPGAKQSKCQSNGDDNAVGRQHGRERSADRGRKFRVMGDSDDSGFKRLSEFDA